MNASAADVRRHVIARIVARLAEVNGRRRTRTVTLAEALACLREVAEGKTYSASGGGSVASAYKYPAISSYVLAARVGSQIRIGFSAGGAIAASVGRAFPELQPWVKGQGPRGDAAAKWAAWAASPLVMALEDMEVDAILESE
jgi:hypothetical protein